jgi:hypothetical protein
VKIVERSGKRLAFGLEWRLLVNSGSPASLAIQQAMVAKAPLMWHDGKSTFAGLVMPDSMATRSLSGSTHLCSAAMAFKRLPGLPPNALLILTMPDNNFALVGISGGRPRRGFDRDNLTSDSVREYYEQFGNLCGDEGFALVGDANLPFIDIDRITPLSLDELAALADTSCALKAPSRKGLYKAMIKVGAVVGCLAILGPWCWRVYRPHVDETQQNDPAAQVRQYVGAHMNDPVVAARDYVHWFAWLRSLSPSYGGWTFQRAACEFHNKQSIPTASYMPWNGVSDCVLTFARTARAIATNETFMGAIPPDWRGHTTYDGVKDAYLVDLQPALFKPTPLRTLLREAGSASDRDVRFMSLLQETAALASPTGSNNGNSIVGMGRAAGFLLPPSLAGGAISCGVQSWSWSSWHIASQLRYVDVLSEFPAWTTLTSATVTISTTPPPNETPFTVDLTGEAVTRNPIVACPRKEVAR